MEPRALTVWEAKERAGLLALETDEWREKRCIAEDPNTTAEILESLSDESIAAWKANLLAFAAQLGSHGSIPRSLLRQQNEPANYVQSLLIEALAAHPNMPPNAMLRLIHSIGKHSAFLEKCSLLHNVCSRGLCANPISTLVILEVPDFWHRLDKEDCLMLLREDSLPQQIVSVLAHHAKNSVKETARLHVSVAGELRTVSEGQAALTLFWKTYRPEETLNRKINYVRAKVAEMQAIPTWIFPRWLRGVLFLITIGKLMRSRSPYVRFVAHLKKKSYGAGYLHAMGRSADWMERLNAAMALPLSDKSFPDDYWNRSPLDLMHHLARDGNRFVRWAAQTRLADPGFVFTWHEDTD